MFVFYSSDLLRKDPHYKFNQTIHITKEMFVKDVFADLRINNIGHMNVLLCSKIFYLR